MQEVLIKYSEIKLKGKNQKEFIKQLVKNIKLISKYQNTNLIEVKRIRDKIICIFDDDIEKINQTLKSIMGIRTFSHITVLEKDYTILKTYITQLLEKYAKENVKTISFKTRRSNKQFQPNSMEMSADFGEIASNLGMKINFKTYDKIVFTEVNDRNIVVYSDKIDGPGGLPINTAGKVLCLLSGGIDSPVAAYLTMKRGATIDFIHFHSYASNELAYKSKIAQTVKLLNNYQAKARLYLVPYSIYDMLTSGKIEPRYELIFFKHWILTVSKEVANNNHLNAIITGDNLAQVASQTLENLRVSQMNIDLPILRPLITYDKEDIITKAVEIGTYEKAIEEYKDCCSMYSKNQTTKAKPEKFQEILDKFDFDNLVKKTLEEITPYDIN